MWSFTVPTSGGTEHVGQAVTLTYGPLRGGVFAVEFRSERFSGTAEVTPLEGDCVTKPITKVHFKGEGRAPFVTQDRLDPFQDRGARAEANSARATAELVTVTYEEAEPVLTRAPSGGGDPLIPAERGRPGVR